MTLLSERDSRETGRQEMFQVAVMAETEVGHTVREWNRLVDSTVVMRDSTESVHRRQAQEESKPEIHFHQNRLKSNRRS